MFFKKLFNSLIQNGEKTTKKGTKSVKKIDDDLMNQLTKFREDTKSLDYLRKEMEEANKGRSEEEILKSLAQAFNSDNEKRA